VTEKIANIPILQKNIFPMGEVGLVIALNKFTIFLRNSESLLINLSILSTALLTELNLLKLK